MKKAIIITASVIVMGSGTGILPAGAAAETVSHPALLLAAAPSHHGAGTVTAIDKAGKRIEFKHGPIESLGWMGMTMYFDVDDAALLEEVDVGDQVNFEFIETRDQRFVVTDIEVK